MDISIRLSVSAAAVICLSKKKSWPENGIFLRINFAERIILIVIGGYLEKQPISFHATILTLCIFFYLIIFFKPYTKVFHFLWAQFVSRSFWQFNIYLPNNWNFRKEFPHNFLLYLGAAKFFYIFSIVCIAAIKFLV